jgi:hypothetical protein
MENQAGKEFCKESQIRIDSSFARLFHCLEQLDEKQLWWRPNEKMNSVAVLVKHICGNLRQRTVTPINNIEDNRDRPKEFENDGDMSKAELIALVNQINADFHEALANLDPARLTEQRHIQGYDMTLMGAIYQGVAHAEGHIGQIVLLTRIQLGEKYGMFK